MQHKTGGTSALIYVCKEVDSARKDVRLRTFGFVALSYLFGLVFCPCANQLCQFVQRPKRPNPFCMSVCCHYSLEFMRLNLFA